MRCTVYVAVRRKGDVNARPDGFLRAQGCRIAIDETRYVRRQASGLRLTQRAPRSGLVAHQVEHACQFEPHPLGSRLLIKNGAEQHCRLGQAAQRDEHHGEPEPRLASHFNRRVGKQCPIGRFGRGQVASVSRGIRDRQDLIGRHRCGVTHFRGSSFGCFSVAHRGRHDSKQADWGASGALHGSGSFNCACRLLPRQPSSISGTRG